MEVAEVSSTDLGPGPVVVGADELQYELTQQAGSFLANAHITTQGSIAEGNGAMLTLPIQFVQLHDPGGDSGVNRSEVTSTTASGLSGHIIIKNGTDGCRSIILDPNEVFSKLSIGGEDGGDSRVVPLQDLSEVGVGSSLSDLQERGLVQLDENVMAQVSSDIAQNGVVLAGGGDYITQKDGAIPQFASFSFVDGQVVLTTTETGVDDTVTLEGGNLIHPALSAAESVILPGPVPISIKKEPDVDPPVGKGPFTCEYCKLTIVKWPQYNKHLKKHLEDKPFQCFACEASFNIEKNLKLHEALHNSEKLECPECSKTFRRLASFKAHLVIHEEDESVSCEICQEEFVSIKQLEPHIHSHSASGMEEQKKLNLECRECGAEFSTEALLTHHLKAHKKVKKMTAAKPRKKIADRSKFDNKCMECGKHFIKPSQLLRHLRIHTGERPFKCLYPGCDRAFNQKYTMLIHMDIHTGNKAFKCEFCNKEFVQKSNLRCHIKRVHPVNKTGQELFECEECSCIFRRAGSLNAHISRAHTNESVFATDLPSDVRDVIKEIQDLQKLGQQPQNGTPMYKNKLKSTTSQQQDGQLKRKNNGSNVNNTANTSTSENANPGDILQQALKNIGLPQSKDQTVHGTKPKVNPEDQSTQEDNNWTPEDGDSSRFKDYRKVRLLNLIDRSHDNGVKKHTVLVRMVGDVKWHMCVYKDCTKEFKKPSDLVRHMRIHTNDKPFKCTKCFRAFGVKSTLMAHMKTHLALKEHACDKCDKTFTTSTSLRVHSWLHTGQKPYPCPLCNKVFRTASHRKNHMLSHQHSPHRQAQRRRSIPLPDIPLQEPIRITTEGPVKQSPRYSQIYPNETGEVAPDRPHKCHMCPAAFKKSSHLKQHVRTHTGERPYKCDNCDKQFNSRSVLRAHYKTHTGQRNHACHLCGGLFASSSSLKRHETTHSADRPYMCPYCQKTFKTNTNCKKHMKTHKHELAMEAVRAAGSSLQGDNQQALLTASLYSQQAATPSLSDNEVIVSDLGGMTSVFPEGEFHITGHLQQQSQHQPQQHQEDLTGTQVLPAAFAQGVTENGLTLADLQTEVEHGLASGDTVILASQPTGITTHLGGSSVLLPHPGEGHEARGTTILLPHSSSNRVTNASSLLQGTNSSSILLPDSSSNQRSHSSVSGQEDAGATLIALPHSTDGRVVTVHQPSVIQGPAREDSANVTSVIQPQPSIINQSQSSNYSGRQALLDPAHTFSNPLGENGTLEMVTIPTSMITGSSQNSYTSQVIQANLHIEGSRESDITSTTNPTNAGEANLGRAVSSAPDSDTRNVMETDNVCVITGHGSTDASANNDSSTTLLEANFDHQGFSEGFTLQVPPGLDLSTLGQGGEIPATQLAQLLNSQVSVPEESPMKVTSSIPSSEPQTKEQDPPEPVVSVSMLYECNECNRTFRKLSNLRSHRRIHSQAKTYCCSTCNKNWSTQDLKAHQQQQAHSSPQSNRCGNCSLIFPSLGQLLKHMQGDHASVWQCPECEDVFDNSPSYQKPRQQNDSAANQHASKKNKETPGTAANEEVCVKRDTDIVIVDENVEDKTADTFEEDPLQNTKVTDLEESDQQRHAHQCKNCSKSFKKPSDLVRHIRTHTGERPYSCALCGKSFAVKSTLDVHMKTHSGKKDFMCHICNTMFATKGSLNIHMRLHTGAKPFKCAQCDLKFRTSGHRKAHVLKHLKAPQTLVKVDNAKTPQIEEPMEVSDTAMDNVMEIPNVDGLNSVVMLPDGTMSLQLQGLNIVGAIDASALLNIQPVTLDESVLNQLQASEVTMMATGEGGVDEDAEDSISVNPNVVMTHPRSIRTSGSNESLEESDLEIHMVDGDGRVITTHTLNMINQQLSRESATTPETSYITQEISLSDLAVPLHNNTLQCALCSKTFVKLSDWQMHLMVHNIFLKVDDEECETDIQNSEVVPQSLNEVSDSNFSATQAVNASALTVEGMTVSKLEESASTHVKCAVPRCGRTFESQTSLDQHIINTHIKQHECSKCEGQVFTSAAALQKHIKTQHNDSKGVRCIFCSEKFSLRGSLHQHIVQEHLQLAIENPVLTEKLGLRINFTPESQRTQGNIEELDPLELFPSVN